MLHRYLILNKIEANNSALFLIYGIKSNDFQKKK